MSESVRPISSQTAMSIAFKKARRKFPKNFGLNSNHAEKERSESEEDPPSLKTESEEKSSSKSLNPFNDQICGKSISDCVESELADSFKEVKLSEEPEIICDHCQDHPENIVDVDLKLDRPILNERDKCENVFFKKQEPAYDYGYENELPPKPDPSTYTYHETRQSIGLLWNNGSDHCDNYDSDIVETPPRKFTEETPTRRKRPSHRRKKSSHCQSDSYYIHQEDHESFEYPMMTNSCCPCHEHCAHCQHCHRHCGCCRAHYCCCSRCCLIWQERAVEACSSCCSRRRRSKKKRCSTCNGKRRSSSPSIPCSRDSGIFTQTRFEDYDDEEEEATLMHKDSLSILQEKYAKRNGRRRDEDEEERTKGRKTCKRVSGRYSYY